MEKVRKLEQGQDYASLIKFVRSSIKKDSKTIKDKDVKEWLGKRWRNIFISEAAKDPKSVAVATEKKLFGGKDNRSDREKVAYRFLRAEGPDEWSLDMPEAEYTPLKKTTLVFCPGLLTGLLPVLAFQDAFPIIEEEYGVRVIQSDSHPVRGCEANLADLTKAIDKGIGLDANSKPISEADAVPPKDIFIISYSKGTPDLLHLLVKRPDLKKRIRCIFNWAGAPGGSYLANSMYDSIKDLNLDIKKEFDTMLHLLSPVLKLPDKLKRLGEYDIQGALRDLSTPHRAEFLKENMKKIDAMGIPIFNITGSTTPLEVPYFQLQGVLELNKYDANNDMQVTQKHSKIFSPWATDLAMLHGHHWDISYNEFPKNYKLGSPNMEHPFPKTAALVAMVKFARETGLID